MNVVNTRIEKCAALDGIAVGDRFRSNGYEFTVDQVDGDGTVWAHRPLERDEDFERSYAYRSLERL